MANIGTIQAVTGVVKAIAEDGSERILSVGDKVAENEKIITSDGVIVIAFTDGTVMDLGSNSSIVLNDDVLNQEGEQVASSKIDAESEVAALQEALANDPNFDPTQALPATAAGAPAAGTDGNSGHGSVSVEHINSEAVVNAGFDTTGISVAFPEVNPELPPVTEVSVIDDGSPSITISNQTDVAYAFTITNNDHVSSAGYHSSYGYYVKDAAGNPTTGVVVWDDVHDRDTTPVSVTGLSPDQIGFFIIPNGENKNGSLTDNSDIIFKFVDNSGAEVSVGTAGAQWQAFDVSVDPAGTPLIGTGSHVLFDVAALNIDGKDHVEDNPLLVGNQNWEDLQIPHGDGDYNDVNVDVVWTKVTATGDAVDFSFGADGPGSVDFSLGAVTINGDPASALDALTYNGDEIFFEARDTDADGNNDLLVGRTLSVDNVLTIDGILDSGDLDITLLGPIGSTNIGSDDVEITANIQVTDSDGDIATAMLNFNIDVNIINTPAVDIV